MYRSVANLVVMLSRSSGSTPRISWAVCSLGGTFRMFCLGGLRCRYHSIKRRRYFMALTLRTSSLLTICLMRLLTNRLLVMMVSPFTTLSIHSLTGRIAIVPRPTSCSRGYTSAGRSACKLGLGIGFALLAAAWSSSREGKETVDAAIASRTIEAAASRIGLDDDWEDF